MITLRPGSHVRQLLSLLAVCGEFPYRSLSLLGYQRAMQRLIYQLERPQEIRGGKGGEVYRLRTLCVSGKKESKTVRLYKGALPLLRELHPDALPYYLSSFNGHRFPGDLGHIDRNHRVAEVLAILDQANIDFRPYVLPELQRKRCQLIPDHPCFYLARDIKRAAGDSPQKTAYSRMVGALFYPGGFYSVFNARNAAMRWYGRGELKLLSMVNELAALNAGVKGSRAALLWAGDPYTAMRTVEESGQERRLEYNFAAIYRQIHYIPLHETGARLLRLLTLADWRNKLLKLVFPPQMLPDGYGVIEYDAQRAGTFIFSHLDGDLARLRRFRAGLETSPDAFEVLCFPWQTAFLRDYLGERVALRQLELSAVEQGLKLT